MADSARATPVSRLLSRGLKSSWLTLGPEGRLAGPAAPQVRINRGDEHDCNARACDFAPSLAKFVLSGKGP